jgi:hypothetical protein
MGTYGEWKGHDLLLQEDRRPLFAEAGLPRAREIRPKGTRSTRISVVERWFPALYPFGTSKDNRLIALRCMLWQGQMYTY